MLARALKILLLVLAALGLSAGSAWAEGQAGRPGRLFSFGAGARPLGMGGAYTAVSRDHTSLYYNPGGLAYISRRQVGMMHANLFEGASYDYLGYAQGFSKMPGGFGVQILRLGATVDDARDEFNQELGSFGYSEIALGFGGGIRGIYFPKLSAGVGGKILQRTLGSSSDRLIGMDLGLQYGPVRGGKLSFGLSARNLVGFSMGDTDDKLPFDLRVGAGYRLFDSILLAADISSSGEISIGTEYAFRVMSMRVGFADSYVSFGGGVKMFKSWTLDLAVANHPDLGTSPRISVGYKFGASKHKRHVEAAANLVRKAEEAIRKRDYLTGFALYRRALSFDPVLEKTQTMDSFKRLDYLIKSLDLAKRKDKAQELMVASPQAELGAIAVQSFLAQRDRKAVLFAHAALGTDPESKGFQNLLGAISRKTGIPIDQDIILPAPTLIQEKLDRGLKYFRGRRYELSVRACWDALLLDPMNVLALKRLGSNYFAAGDMEKSKRTFLRALEYAPQDQSILRFLKMRGWK